MEVRALVHVPDRLGEGDFARVGHPDQVAHPKGEQAVRGSPAAAGAGRCPEGEAVVVGEPEPAHPVGLSQGRGEQVRARRRADPLVHRGRHRPASRSLDGRGRRGRGRVDGRCARGLPHDRCADQQAEQQAGRQAPHQDTGRPRSQLPTFHLRWYDDAS